MLAFILGVLCGMSIGVAGLIGLIFLLTTRD